jgi:hypothetical protein
MALRNKKDTPMKAKPDSSPDYLTEKINLDNDYILKNLQVPSPSTPSFKQINTMRDNSEIICYGLQLRKAPILALDFTFDCEDDKTIDFLDDYLRPHINTLIEKILLAQDYGYIALLKTYEYRDNYIVPCSNRPYRNYDWEDIYLYADENGDLIGLKSSTQEVLASKIVLATWDRQTDGREGLYGRTILKQAYNHYYTQTILTIIRNRFLENQGTPFFVSWYPIGATDIETTANSAKALATVKALKSNSVITLPFNPQFEKDKQPYQVEVITAGGDGKHFLEHIQDLDKRMFFSLYIPNSYVDRGGVEGGTYAESISRAAIVQLSAEADIRWIEGIINNQVIPELCELNGFDITAKLNISPILDTSVEIQNEIMKAVADGRANIKEVIEIGLRLISEKTGTDLEEVREAIQELEDANPPEVVQMPGLPVDKDGNPIEEVDENGEVIPKKGKEVALENKPQPADKKTATERFIKEAGNAYTRAQRDIKAGRFAYKEAAIRLLNIAYKQGQAKHISEAKGLGYTINKIVDNTSDIKLEAKYSTDTKFNRIQTEISYLKKDKTKTILLWDLESKKIPNVAEGLYATAYIMGYGSVKVK